MTTARVTTLTAALAAALILLCPPLANAAQPHAAAGLAAVDVNNGFADLAQAVKPAVVTISTSHTAAASNATPFKQQMPPEFERFFRRFFDHAPGRSRPGQDQRRERKSTAVGSGFIIDPTGLVVTNYHVIDDADEIEVVFDDGIRVPATLKGSDRKTDLALLQINAGKPLPFVKFGDSDAARVGDWVIAIGNPFGLGGTTTSGIISARGRDIHSGPFDDFIQIDAPINRGNSGGPLFNTRGEVIGVNSAIFSPNGGSVGIGFAIPSAQASDVIAQLRDSGVVQRGYLGVIINDVSAEIAEVLGLEKADGAMVAQVIRGSPAEKTGIEAGDIILAYDGTPVKKTRDLPKLVALTKSQAKVDIDIWRNGQRKTLQVAIGDQGEFKNAVGALTGASESARLGFTVGALNDARREEYDIDENAGGVVIVALAKNGVAVEHGLRIGDLIARIDTTPVRSPSELEAAIQVSRETNPARMLLLIVRDKHARYVKVTMNS